jgi:hypothetical protein
MLDPMEGARELFFKYDGSRFYMSRDGVEDDYLRYSVPKHLETQWLEELTAAKLNMLETSGNWLVVHFLSSHSDTRHLARLTRATPRGEFWQRCAYLEELLRYVKMCAHAGAINEIQMREAAEYVLEQARIIDADAGHEDCRYRVRPIIEAATELHSSTR